MDIENLIKDTFTAREHDAPDGDAVLAAARHRIDSRRSALSRPLAVAAGATVLSLGAVTGVVLNRPDSAEQSRTVAAGAQSSQAAAGPAIADLRMPYSLGWLPPGTVAYRTQRINVGFGAAGPQAPLYGGEYMLTVTEGGQELFVDVQQFRMTDVDRAAFKSGPGAPLTIKGQRAAESSVSDGAGGYELYVAHPDGGSMYVHVSAGQGSTAPAKQLVEAGRRIAENIQFPGATTVTPSYGLRDLPAGMRICAFSVDPGLADRVPAPRGPNTSYSLGTCTVLPTVLITSAAAHDVAGTPGKPVQGHETRYVDDNGYHRLWILNALGETPIFVAGEVPEAELYDIANRLVLPH
ncbi:hypothetical protein [Lentzea sp. NPDC059081]|uniref:hypothetical protein n=1 Tax=Lentzea sp. NPDC059081 TaxID=3346719 RepID=UPI003674B1F9